MTTTIPYLSKTEFEKVPGTEISLSGVKVTPEIAEVWLRLSLGGPDLSGNSPLPMVRFASGKLVAGQKFLQHILTTGKEMTIVVCPNEANDSVEVTKRYYQQMADEALDQES